MIGRLIRRLFGAELLCIAMQALLATGGAAGHLRAAEQNPPPSKSLFPRVRPTEPAEAVATIRVLGGFEMVLIAHEPLVMDPVDLAYDENGLAYVVEMRGYPYPEGPDEEPKERIGRVRILEDSDGDGEFDTSYVFADGLSWPTSVVPWKGGVFVAAAPDLWYFKDSDGDRQADVRERVLTGFGRRNVQAIMNNLRWGLDHRIYGAASGNGGNVRSLQNRADKAVSLSRRDFRFDPRDGSVEAISGGARFGNSFDDWGNRFVCNIRNPAQHVVLPARYLARNSRLAVSQVMHDVAESGDQIPVYRISPPEPWRELRARRWVNERMNYPRSELVGAGFFTSSSGVTVYRGAAYPAEFRGNVFVSDVAGNLVHRQKLTRMGVTFQGERADEKAEFISSTDIWFRPVNFVNAPDGTLHVLDMYREAIEHPWSIPDDIKAELDLQSGNDRGRIYRLLPPGFEPSPPPQLGMAATVELVATLENPSSWWRETAHRLLYERQDPDAIEPLRGLLLNSEMPLARLHALWSLEGLAALSDRDLMPVLKDESAGVRRHAVRLAEPRLKRSPAVRRTIMTMADDPDPCVRLQVAFTLGEMTGDDVVDALAVIARRDAGDDWIRTAILSSSGRCAGQLLVRLVRDGRLEEDPAGIDLLREIAEYVGAAGTADEIDTVLATVMDRSEEGTDEALEFGILAGLGDGLRRNGKTLQSLIESSSTTAGRRVRHLLERASSVAADPASSVEARVQAIQLLRHERFDRTNAALSSLLSPEHPQSVQLAAVRVLATFPEPAVADVLLESWRQHSPAVRSEIIEVVLGRTIWTRPFLDAVDAGRILASQVPIRRRALLLGSREEDIRRDAERIFGADAPAPRGEVVAKYDESLRLDGNAARGREVFRRECRQCHRLGGEGHDVGPDMSTIRHRSPEEIMIHVLDPNREVQPKYIDYAVALKDGRVLTGTIVTETATSLTLKRAENSVNTVLRSDIEQITSTGKSIMPEGVEQKINPQQMADLLAYLLHPDSVAADAVETEK